MVKIITSLLPSCPLIQKKLLSQPSTTHERGLQPQNTDLLQIKMLPISWPRLFPDTHGMSTFGSQKPLGPRASPSGPGPEVTRSSSVPHSTPIAGLWHPGALCPQLKRQDLFFLVPLSTRNSSKALHSQSIFTLTFQSYIPKLLANLLSVRKPVWHQTPVWP